MAVLVDHADNCCMQKFVARKSKKFLAQDDSLVLPGLELSYMLSCLSLATRQAIVQVHLPEVAATLAQLEAIKAKEEGALPAGWWDGASEFGSTVDRQQY